MATQEDIEKWVKELSNPDAKVRENAAEALGYVAKSGEDISSAVPALVKALSDKDDIFGALAAWASMMAAEKTEIDLEGVKKTLIRFVEKEGKKGAAQRKFAERKAGECYVKIATAVSKRKTSIGMDGLLLDGTIKPPSDKGPKMYRERVAV